MFLHLEDRVGYVIVSIGSRRRNERHNYPASDECVRLVRYWQDTDALGCGVFADWLDDHRSELLEGASGPSDPATRLDALIESLRKQFRNARSDA